MALGALEALGEDQIFDIRSHHTGPALVHERQELLVHVFDVAIERAEGNGVARDLDQARNLRELAFGDGFHGTPPLPAATVGAPTPPDTDTRRASEEAP